MANEIGLQHTQTAKTLYVLIRNLSQQIWDDVGSSFVDYVTANLGNYDVLSTGEQGAASRFYPFDFPSAIVKGLYNVSFFDRVGGSPAETDPLVGSLTVHWDGTVEVLPFDVRNDLIDTVKFNEVMEVLLAMFGGEHELVDLGGGLKRYDCKKQDGSTDKLKITFDQNGQWTTVAIV